MDFTVKDLRKLGTQENIDEGIRQLRDPVWKAYTTYVAHIFYGDITETAEEHEKLLKWAQRLRDKDVTALTDIPEKVMYYLSKEDRLKYNKTN